MPMGEVLPFFIDAISPEVAATAGAEFGTDAMFNAGSEFGTNAAFGALGAEGMAAMQAAGLQAAQAAKDTELYNLIKGVISDGASPADAAKVAADSGFNMDAIKKSISGVLKTLGLDKLEGKDLLKYAGIFAAGSMAGGQPQQPSGPKSPQYIRPKKAYRDEQGRLAYYDLPSVDASKWGSQSIDEYKNSQIAPSRAANGGLMAAYANGGPVQHYVDGGVTDEQIKSYVNANLGNPEAIASRAKEFGVSADRLSSATGYNPTQVNDYFKNAVQQDYSNASNAQGLSKLENTSKLNNLVNNLGITQQQATNVWGNNADVNKSLGVTGFNYATTPAANPTTAAAANPTTAAAVDPMQGIRNAYTGGDSGYWTGKGDIADAVKTVGLGNIQTALSDPSMQSSYGASKAYVDPTTGKPVNFTAAQDYNQLAAGKSFGDVATNINKWVENNKGLIATDPQTARAKGEELMYKAGLNQLDVQRATGKTLDQLFAEKKKEADTGGGTTSYTPSTYTAATNPFGNTTNPGDITKNTNGTVIVQPNIPGRLPGGFSGIKGVTDAYTAGGGSTGYTNPIVKSMAELEKLYPTSGGTKAAYDYLSGKPGATWASTNTQPRAAASDTYGVEDLATVPEEMKLKYADKPFVLYKGRPIKNPYYKNAAATTAAAPVDSGINVTGAKGGLMAAYANGGGVRRYDDGGVTDEQIKSYVNSHVNDPQAIADRASELGVSMDRLSSATGYKPEQVQNYFQSGLAPLYDQAKELYNNYKDIKSGNSITSPITSKLSQYIPNSWAANPIFQDVGTGLSQASKVPLGKLSPWQWLLSGVGNTMNEASNRLNIDPMMYKQESDPMLQDVIPNSYPNSSSSASADPYSDAAISGASDAGMSGASDAGISGVDPYAFTSTDAFDTNPSLNTGGSDSSLYEALTGINDTASDYGGAGLDFNSGYDYSPSYSFDSGSYGGYGGDIGYAAGGQPLRTKLSKDLQSKYSQLEGQGQANSSQGRQLKQELDYRTRMQSYGQPQEETQFAAGGISHLGGYSDGGRLLRGPGDGVSDSIPATIGDKQPARLADGEFVVPARIVSEIGNGSTEAGARKLYAMMDRVQKARSQTVGKGKIARNTRADKYLPV